VVGRQPGRCPAAEVAVGSLAERRSLAAEVAVGSLAEWRSLAAAEVDRLADPVVDRLVDPGVGSPQPEQGRRTPLVLAAGR
jgi:hypothetical protein